MGLHSWTIITFFDFFHCCLDECQRTYECESSSIEYSAFIIPKVYIHISHWTHKVVLLIYKAVLEKKIAAAKQRHCA